MIERVVKMVTSDGEKVRGDESCSCEVELLRAGPSLLDAAEPNDRRVKRQFNSRHVSFKGFKSKGRVQLNENGILCLEVSDIGECVCVIAIFTLHIYFSSPSHSRITTQHSGRRAK
jgi:hypothetical protein